MGRYSDLSWDASRLWELEGRDYAGDGLDDAAELLLASSRAVAPLDKGPLVESGRISRDGLDAIVSYNTVYAVRQHEELDWRHAPGRQAKYLEQPFNELHDEMVRLIAARISEWLAG